MVLIQRLLDGTDVSCRELAAILDSVVEVVAMLAPCATGLPGAVLALPLCPSRFTVTSFYASQMVSSCFGLRLHDGIRGRV